MTTIAILSDTHDNIANLDKALAQIQASGAEVLLHCGDLCAPFMVSRLAQGFSGPIHIVFGNNDGDGRLLQSIASKHPHVTLHGIYAEISVGRRQIAMIHYPEPAKRIAQSGQLDLVCYGHNHQRHHETIGRCHLVNPGELLGMYGVVTWGLYDATVHTYVEQVIE
jgi:putative phosphoesterase